MSRPLPKPQTMTIQEWVESKNKVKKKRTPGLNRNRKSFKNPPRLPIQGKLKKPIVFIDNDDGNWKTDMSRFKDSIDYIPIPSSDNDHSPEESNYTESLAKKGNLYAAAIIDIAGPKSKSYPPNNGINESVAKTLKTWASHQGDENPDSLCEAKREAGFRRTEGSPAWRLRRQDCRPLDAGVSPNSAPSGSEAQEEETRRSLEKYALFDWDRTISCIEGVVGRAFEFEEAGTKEFLDDAFLYLMREDRIPMLKDLFRHLRGQGVHIHILTNNPGASIDSPYRAVFIEMMSRLFNEDDEQAEERDYVEKGVRIHIFSSSISKVSLISREELESMLHSTVDYTMAGQPLHKSNMVCHIVPGMRRCPPVPLIPLNKKKKTRRREPVLVIV